jgi:hypothetical protein
LPRREPNPIREATLLEQEGFLRTVPPRHFIVRKTKKEIIEIIGLRGVGEQVWRGSPRSTRQTRASARCATCSTITTLRPQSTCTIR